MESLQWTQGEEAGEMEEALMGRKGHESVWDYPRPPRLEASERHLKVVHAGVVIAETTRSMRVLETSHPPVYYIPQEDIRMERMRASSRGSSFCEFKGVASYWALSLNETRPGETGLGETASGETIVPDIAWSYGSPSRSYAGLKNFLAFYASRVDECWVDGERVEAQPGDFYGGWITSHVTGPFKGAPGTLGW